MSPKTHARERKGPAETRQPEAAHKPTAQELADILSRTLPEKGLDRMTLSRIESQLCTSALTAHL